MSVCVYAYERDRQRQTETEKTVQKNQGKERRFVSTNINYNKRFDN